jgi:hypothetical protein
MEERGQRGDAEDGDHVLSLRAVSVAAPAHGDGGALLGAPALTSTRRDTDDMVRRWQNVTTPPI